MLLTRLLLVTASLLGLGAAFAAPPFEAPYLTRPIMDETGTVRASIDQAEEAIRGLKSQTGVQLTVYLPASLRELDIESFSMTVAEQWKLGRKGEDKGILLVIAPRERRMRMEVGYGLEGQLTDARSRRILDEVLRPYLRAGRTGDGIIAVVGAVAEAVGSQWRPTTVAPPLRSIGRPHLARSSLSLSAALFLVFFILFLMVLPSIAYYRNNPLGRRVRGTRYGSASVDSGNPWWGSGSSWRDGGGSGGGWSGGGGSFGGGGASSDW